METVTVTKVNGSSFQAKVHKTGTVHEFRLFDGANMPEGLRPQRVASIDLDIEDLAPANNDEVTITTIEVLDNGVVTDSSTLKEDDEKRKNAAAKATHKLRHSKRNNTGKLVGAPQPGSMNYGESR